MIYVSGPCYPSVSQGVHHPNQLYTEVIDSTSSSGTKGSDAQLRSFMCNLSILKEKVNQVQSYVNIFLPQQNHPHSLLTVATHDQSTSSMAVASMGTMIQEIIVTASSMMFNCQQMALGSTNEGNHNHQPMANNSSHIMLGVDDGLSQNVRTSTNNNNNNNDNNNNSNGNNGHAFFDGEGFYSWCTDNVTCNMTTTTNNHSSVTSNSFRVVATNTAKTSTTEKKTIGNKIKESKKEAGSTSILLSQEGAGYDIVELDAADLLAKYTHYCQVCGKGFKRDANLRMHMRAHGDEYKSSAALSNPLKKKISTNNNNGENSSAIKVVPRKYSCPHEGCRWNKKHAKFQPLKSIICVKNHYKRSHCPKMYVCKRCTRKQFSVLSDLRTHEKHCGDLKWQCSCGTTFSRKDKLMGHVALFVGHSPMVINNPLGTLDKLDTNPQHGLQIHFKDR